MALSIALIAGCSFDKSGISFNDAGENSDARARADSGASADARGSADASPPATYVAYWSFDVDASDAAGAHDGVLVGDAAITIGGQGFAGGEALRLFADGDRVDIAAPTTFDFNRDFTWHAYIKTTDGSGALLSRNPAGSAWNQGSKALFVRGDEVEWDTGWVSNPGTGVVVTDDEWHQVIVTFEADTDALRIFVDASLGDTQADFDGVHEVDRFDEHVHVHNNGIADTGFSIGAANFTGGLASLDTLVGLIDEVAVFDRVLSGAELDHLITLGPSSL